MRRLSSTQSQSRGYDAFAVEPDAPTPTGGLFRVTICGYTGRLCKQRTRPPRRSFSASVSDKGSPEPPHIHPQPLFLVIPSPSWSSSDWLWKAGSWLKRVIGDGTLAGQTSAERTCVLILDELLLLLCMISLHTLEFCELEEIPGLTE